MEFTEVFIVISTGLLAKAVVSPYQMLTEEREAMGRLGRDYVEKNHDIIKLAEQLEEVMRRLLTGSAKV